MKKAIVHDKRIDVSEISKLIIRGDAIDSISFIVPRYQTGTDLSLYDMYLRYENDAGIGEDVLLSTVSDTGCITCVWKVNGGFTQDKGQHKIQLWCSQIVDNVVTMKWQTYPALIEVNCALDPKPIAITTPTILEEYLSLYQSIAADALYSRQACSAAADSTLKAAANVDTDINSFNTKLAIAKNEIGDRVEVATQKSAEAARAALDSRSSAINAEDYATNAKESEVATMRHCYDAAVSELTARSSERKAESSELNAKSSELNTKEHETNAKESEVEASMSATKAKAEADRAAAIDAYSKPQADGRFAPISQGVKRYSVRWSGTLSTGIREDNAVGMVADVGIDNQIAVNDFDNVPIFNRPICCCTWDKVNQKWKVNAYKGEPTFKVDGSNGEVMYECTPFYYKGNLNIYISVTATPIEGYSLAPMFKNGTDKVYLPCYQMGIANNIATSRSGIFPIYGSLNTLMTTSRTFDSNAHTETLDAHMSEYILQLVEFANKDLQSVMMGASTNRYNGADIITSVLSPTSFTTTATVGGYFAVGQTICIGNTKNGTNRTNSVKVESITISANAATFVLSMDVAGMTAGDFISTRGWITGATDDVKATSGSPVSNTSGLYPCAWRGKENPWGNMFSGLCDVLIKRTGIEGSYEYRPCYLADKSDYSAGAITADYQETSFYIPITDGYIKEFSCDKRFNVFLPSLVGASSTTYFSDYYQFPRYATCCVVVGGSWGYSGNYTGAACFFCDRPPSDNYILIGARLFV